MGLLDVPRGVTPRSGLLVATGTITTADAETNGVRMRFDLGPGFGTGIHGWAFRQIPQILTVDGDAFRQLLVADPDVALTTALDVQDPRVIGGAQSRYDLSTNGAYVAEFEQRAVILPAPVLTVRDLTYQVSNDIDGSTAVVGFVRLYYSIYEITDAEFVRIAGVSLARG